MRQLLFLFLFTCSFFSSCSNNDDKNRGDNNNPEIPIDIEEPTEATKPIQMWIDAHANLSRFANKKNIASYMEKMKETGFNEVYVDVKPGIGYALYDSDILPQLTKWGNEIVNRDWDYLAFWIEEAERLDMKVIASLSVMGYGYTKTKEGLIYDDDRWNGKTQVEMPDNNPDNLVDMRDQTNIDAAMLDPSLPEVQSFVISIIEEIATKYPKLKGICLDYCRWY
ncbi:MAG: family 10 glycosylhydrolase, partial [Proteiniphilum sp.]|nr:family 10 glycosylhydrolase [Proteiniphilum sp.]